SYLPPTPDFDPLSLHDALPISFLRGEGYRAARCALREIVQSARPTRALLRVDPRLLDHERLPEARRDAPDLVVGVWLRLTDGHRDRKSTRLNSSHGSISYAVSC